MTEAGGVRASLFLTNQQRPGADQLEALKGQLRLCREARDCGWDGIFVGQHYLSEGLTQLHPIPFLARLAAEAGHMLLGVGICLVALQNPVDVAEAYASLDVICEGRFIFGVGLGYRNIEYKAFGIDPSVKLCRFERNLEIVLALWSGESVSCDLPWCHLDEERLSLTPYQRPRPPLWMAANSDEAVKRAARVADTWMINPHARRSTIERQIELFRAARVSAGREPIPLELPLMREVFCASSREKALEIARPYLEAKYQLYADWGQDKVLPDNDSFSVPFEQLSDDRFVVGAPEDCIAALLPWRDGFGVNHFVIRTDWAGMPADVSVGSLRLLASEVLPVLRIP